MPERVLLPGDDLRALAEAQGVVESPRPSALGLDGPVRRQAE